MCSCVCVMSMLCVRVRCMKTLAWRGTNSHTCVTRRGRRRGFDLFVAYHQRLRGKQLYYTVVAVMCVAREPDGKSSECSDYSSCRRKYDACGALVFFKAKHFFILLARRADGQLHSPRHSCSVPRPRHCDSDGVRGQKRPSSYHVVRFAGNEF